MQHGKADLAALIGIPSVSSVTPGLDQGNRVLQVRGLQRVALLGA